MLGAFHFVDTEDVQKFVRSCEVGAVVHSVTVGAVVHSVTVTIDGCSSRAVSFTSPPLITPSIPPSINLFLPSLS
jgi:hypothetical protein